MKSTPRSITKILEDGGLSEETLVSAAMELYVPHSGVENRDIAEKVFKRELKLALVDPNLCILLYAGILLEKEGEKGELPGMSKETFDKLKPGILAETLEAVIGALYLDGGFDKRGCVEAVL